MAELKRRSLLLSTGKQLKLHGISMAIGKSMEIGEGGAPNIYFSIDDQKDGKTISAVSNPHKLTVEELSEIADYNIRLWIDFKDSIRKHGVNNPKIFTTEG